MNINEFNEVWADVLYGIMDRDSFAVYEAFAKLFTNFENVDFFDEKIQINYWFGFIGGELSINDIANMIYSQLKDDYDLDDVDVYPY